MQKGKLTFTFNLIRSEMISANDRMHFQKKAKLTKHLRELAHYKGLNTLHDLLKLPYSEDKPCRVRVICYPPTNRRYDPPNWSPTVKALLDGFTDARIWTDDNYHVIREVSFSHGGKSGGKHYQLVLEIEEI